MENAEFIPLSEYKYRPSRAWTRWNKNNSTYLTDGHTLLRRKYVKGILKRMTSTAGHDRYSALPINANNESMKKIMDKWIPTHPRAQISDTVRCNGIDRKRQSCTVTVYRNEGENHMMATLCADKVALILKKVANPTFYLDSENPDSHPVWIKSGRALVGCVMPLRV